MSVCVELFFGGFLAGMTCFFLVWKVVFIARSFETGIADALRND